MILTKTPSRDARLTRIVRRATVVAAVTAIMIFARCSNLRVAAQAPSPQDATVKLLQELTNANAAPGFEGPVRNILKREWQGLLKDLRTDGLGNLLGSLPGPADGPRVLVMAHMDEVGFMVRYIDANGFVYFHPIGTNIDQAVLTQRFTIMTPRGPVVGYTGVKSPHIVPPEERNSMVQVADMFLDLGVKSRDEAEKLGVRPGLPMTYRTEFEILNGGTNRYLAKAFDDRVGCAIITQALQTFQSTPHPNLLEVAATVQEELGSRGAQVIFNQVKPDIVINLEIGVAGDFPLRTSPKLSQESLGKGATVFIFQGDMIPNNKYVEWVTRLAKAENIPIQYSAVTTYGQDGSALQRAGAGLPTINIGVPTRYAHSESGVIDRGDYDAALKLVVKMIQQLSAAEVKSIADFSASGQ
jgi:putative aminopeptidase FrvX